MKKKYIKPVCLVVEISNELLLQTSLHSSEQTTTQGHVTESDAHGGLWDDSFEDE